MRPDVEIKLVRHGESLSNTREMNPREVGDHKIPLSPLGEQQAIKAGQFLKEWMAPQKPWGGWNKTVRGTGRRAQRPENLPLIYCSPYQRTRQTLKGILEGSESPSDRKVYEDPTIRETERGYTDYHESMEEELREREHYGWFYYRFQGGESPADCYDRASLFLHSMDRQIERKNANKVLIVTHGLFMRCFIMRFMHMTVEEFEIIDNPKNCAVITIVGDKTKQIRAPMYENGRWGLYGIEWREE